MSILKTGLNYAYILTRFVSTKPGQNQDVFYALLGSIISSALLKHYILNVCVCRKGYTDSCHYSMLMNVATAHKFCTIRPFVSEFSSGHSPFPYI